MNWSLEQIMNHNILTPPEQATRSRNLNSYTLHMMNYRHELSRMSSSQHAEWIRMNSPRSLSNIHIRNDGGPLLLSRRVNRTTHEDTLLKPHVIMKKHYRELDVDTYTLAWKNRATYLNSRDAYVDILLDNRVEDVSDSSLQLSILQISYSNLEKLFHWKLKKSNRCSDESGRRDLADKFMSVPHKIKMKRQIVIKMNLDLSLMFYLFGSDLRSKFLENEKAYAGEVSAKVKFYHVRSNRRLNELLSTGTSDSLGFLYAYKTTERWHYAGAKVNLVRNNTNQETTGYVVDDDVDNNLVIEFSNSNNNIETIKLLCPEYDVENKKYLYRRNPTPSRYRIVLYEPIVFRFNLKDPRNNFWFISNRYTKRLRHSPFSHDVVNDANLFFDTNYCS